jgi:RNA polymerase sigma-70 factor (ECF subfamily)
MQIEAIDYSLQLAKRIQEAEPNAFAELYDNYSAMLFGIITRIVENQEDAENLLQDCFIKIWRSIDSFDAEKGKFATWLINIARNTSIDFVRSKYYIQKKKTKTIGNITSNTPQHISLTKTDSMGLKELTAQLNPKYKQIIDWLYFDGLTQQEIADQFDIPLGTVKTRARAALIELRNYFEVKN